MTLDQRGGAIRRRCSTFGRAQQVGATETLKA